MRAAGRGLGQGRRRLEVHAFPPLNPMTSLVSLVAVGRSTFPFFLLYIAERHAVAVCCLLDVMCCAGSPARQGPNAEASRVATARKVAGGQADGLAKDGKGDDRRGGGERSTGATDVLTVLR